MADKENFEREIDQSELRATGQHIVEILNSSKQYDQTVWHDAAKQSGFENMPFGIVMPCAQRNLMLIMKTERLDPDGNADNPDDDPQGVRLCFKELAESLQYMHENGVIHGDVKPLNCGACCQSADLLFAGADCLPLCVLSSTSDSLW